MHIDDIINHHQIFYITIPFKVVKCNRNIILDKVIAIFCQNMRMDQKYVIMLPKMLFLVSVLDYVHRDFKGI